MTVYVNDKPIEAPPGAALDALLKAAGRDPDLAMVTVDGRFVPRSEYRSCAPREGARIRVWELLSGG